MSSVQTWVVTLNSAVSYPIRRTFYLLSVTLAHLRPYVGTTNRIEPYPIPGIMGVNGLNPLARRGIIKRKNPCSFVIAPFYFSYFIIYNSHTGEFDRHDYIQYMTPRISQ